MTGGDPPHRVYGTPIRCSLKQKNARPFWIVRILLNNLCGFHSLDDFPSG